MSESPFTWGDVDFLRREASRRERAATRKAGDPSQALRKAAALRSLADRIEKSLREKAA